jgi:cupin fold WbuC family metalloprotein
MTSEVEFVPLPIAQCDDAALERVRLAAAASPRLRARLCLHRSPDDRLHEMVIVLRRGTQISVHRHPEKEECYHVISGLITLKICDAEGRVEQSIPLGPIGSGRTFVCRIAADLWHTVEVESDEVVMHESTIGPMTTTGTEYLPDRSS